MSLFLLAIIGFLDCYVWGNFEGVARQGGSWFFFNRRVKKISIKDIKLPTVLCIFILWVMMILLFAFIIFYNSFLFFGECSGILIFLIWLIISFRCWRHIYDFWCDNKSWKNCNFFSFSIIQDLNLSKI